MMADVRWWVGWVAAASLLGGCGGTTGDLPWHGVNEQRVLSPVDLLQFDAAAFERAEFSRPADSRAAAADALTTGFRAANLISLKLTPFKQHSAGASLLDQFVFVPTRAPVTELIFQQQGDLTLSGTVSYDSAEPNGARLHRIQVTGPQTDLLLEVLLVPPDRLVTQLDGHDVSPWGEVIRLRRLDDSTFDVAAGRKAGRLRVEAYRADGSLFYASDTGYDGHLTEEQEQLNGRNIWVEPDGYWVRSVFELFEPVEGTYLGPLRFEASDGTRFTLNLAEGGAFTGQVLDRNGQPIATIDSGTGGAAMLVDPEGEQIVSDSSASQQLVLDLVAGTGAANPQP